MIKFSDGTSRVVRERCKIQLGIACQCPDKRAHNTHNVHNIKQRNLAEGMRARCVKEVIAFNKTGDFSVLLGLENGPIFHSARVKHLIAGLNYGQVPNPGRRFSDFGIISKRGHGLRIYRRAISGGFRKASER